MKCPNNAIARECFIFTRAMSETQRYTSLNGDADRLSAFLPTQHSVLNSHDFLARRRYSTLTQRVQRLQFLCGVA